MTICGNCGRDLESVVKSYDKNNSVMYLCDSCLDKKFKWKREKTLTGRDLYLKVKED
jgi:hypothetical protein